MEPRTILLTDLRSPHVPTRVSVPFERGEVRDLAGLTVCGSDGRAVPCQGRSILDWDDGSCKWGLFLFEPRQDEGPFTLQARPNELADRLLVREQGDLYVVDTLSLLVEQQTKKRSYHVPRNAKEFAWALLLRSPMAFVAALAVYLWFAYGGTLIVKPQSNGAGSGHVSTMSVNPMVGKQP